MRKVLLTLALVFSLTTPALSQTYTNKDFVILEVYARDDEYGSGMGPGAMMQFSNDGETWSTPEPFSSLKDNWSLLEYGGNASHTIYVRFMDVAGNWSEPFTAEVIIDKIPPVGGLNVITVIINNNNPSGAE